MKPDFKRFCNESIMVAWEGNGMDGGEIQDLAISCHLLSEEPVTEPCCEVCICAEFGFPTNCFKKTY